MCSISLGRLPNSRKLVNFWGSGQFVTSTEILRAQERFLGLNGRNTEMLTQNVFNFCPRTDFCVPITIGLLLGL